MVGVTAAYTIYTGERVVMVIVQSGTHTMQYFVVDAILAQGRPVAILLPAPCLTLLSSITRSSIQTLAQDAT